jgi:hypothetical protein
MRPLVCSALLLAAASALAEEPVPARERFLKELTSVYDYLPYDVAPEVRKAKVAEMDRFWAFVASDLDVYLPLLRDELRNEKQNQYFFFDGSGLLVEHAKDDADWQLAADATARCRRKDVGDKGFFHFLHHLAAHGADVTAATMQMLDEPQFSVVVPQHAMTLRQADCLRLCVLQMDEERWVGPLVKRLAGEKQPAAARSLLRCLADAATPAGDAAIRSAATDAALDAAAREAAAKLAPSCNPPPAPAVGTKCTREQFEWMLSAFESDGKVKTRNAEDDKVLMALQYDAFGLVRAEDVPRVRAARRRAARRISDEGLVDLTFLTRLIRRARSLAK